MNLLANIYHTGSVVQLLFPSKRCLTFAFSSILTLFTLTLFFYQK